MKSQSVPLLVIVMLVLTASAAHAIKPERKCRDAIRKGHLTVAIPPLIASGKCARQAIVLQRPCDDAKLQAIVAKADTKLTILVRKGCAGKNKQLSDADDVPIADVGWDIGSCPDFGGGQCVAPIATYADVVRCLQCVVDHSTAGILDTAFLDVAPPDPAADGVRKCRAAIGKAALTYARASWSRLAKCWQKLSRRGSGSSCPTNLARKGLAKARARLAATLRDVCRPSLTAAVVGFPATCPDVTPVGDASCARPVTTLADIATCVACVTQHHVDCADRAAVPNFVPFPSECQVPPTP